MGIYDGPSDTPNQIRSEGQQIDVAFVRNGDGTGTIKWTIPAPVAGCSAEDQAYDGIVITVSDIPANYIESSPKDGTYYNADPTFDPDLHAGDKIDTARVVGAFYHDKTTTTLIVQDVKDKTPYYVSAYAVDDVARYHREGSHAYSLPTDSLEYNDTLDLQARHEIGIDLDVINNGTPTGLVGGTDYWFRIVINSVQYDITIHGQDGLTYPDLVNAINDEFVRITGADRKNLTLDTSYYFDVDTNILYRWDYDHYIDVDVIVDEEDPSLPVLGTYWYDGTDLWIYESSGWVQIPLFKLSFDPANPTCGVIWFDGADTWRWNDTHWCKLTTHNQLTNPLLPPVMSCDDYWYDEVNFTLNNWDTDKGGWTEVDAIYTETDPNIIGVGDYWYDETNLKMVILAAGGAWEDLVNIRYEERNEGGDLDNPMAAQYWYIPSEQLFFQRNTNNTAWIALEFTLAVTDPTIRDDCDLWWNSSSVDDLFTWDTMNSAWIMVASFVQSPIDPSLPPILEDDAVWYNPDTGKMQILIASDCSYTDVEYIDFPTDPTKLGVGYAWLDSEGVFRVSDGFGGWTIIDPISSATDPYNVVTGTFWYDQTNNLLKQWNGTDWDTIDTLDGLTYPNVGDIFLNDIDEKLYAWDGTTWVEANAIAGVVLINPNSVLVNPNLVNPNPNRLTFFTNAVGCEQSIFVVLEADNLFTHVSSGVIYYEPVDGNSRLEKNPSWNTLGVGDDGSPDERRALHSIIRAKLGAPSQKVELTDDQLDEALNSALLMIRKYSGYGYHREMFFLDLKPNQQKYTLTNRCVGFNKVTDVNQLYRLRSGFLNGNLSRGGYDIYGYAALLHLYKTGTFDMLSYHLVSSYIEDMQIMFADHLTFNWVEDKRELQLYHTIYDNERVLMDSYIERTEQELFNDRETREWIKRWAIADAKMMLSQVRGKFQTLPGAGGSTTLNSQELITQGETEKADLILELEDPAMQNLGEAGGAAHFIMG